MRLRAGPQVAFSSNYASVRSRVTFMFEFASTGAVLPSYDTQTRVEQDALLDNTSLFVWISFFFTLFFCLLEVIEMAGSGPISYFTDLWNVMDWVNYAIFFLVWTTTLK